MTLYEGIKSGACVVFVLSMGVLCGLAGRYVSSYEEYIRCVQDTTYYKVDPRIVGEFTAKVTDAAEQQRLK